MKTVVKQFRLTVQNACIFHRRYFVVRGCVGGDTVTGHDNVSDSDDTVDDFENVNHKEDQDSDDGGNGSGGGSGGSGSNVGRKRDQ